MSNINNIKQELEADVSIDIMFDSDGNLKPLKTIFKDINKLFQEEVNKNEIYKHTSDEF